METPITFRHGEYTLSGILHEPESHPKDTAVLLVMSGSRGRLGSSFQFVYYARELASRGYPVLRFDPHGMGDSEGLIPHENMFDFYGSVSRGRFVDDAVTALDELRERTSPKRVVLLGNCGGSITALLAAARSTAKIHSVVLLSMPVLLDGDGHAAEQELAPEYAKNFLLQQYSKKLLSAKAWARLLSGRSQTDVIVQYGRVALRGLGKVGERALERWTGKSTARTAPKHDERFNHAIVGALEVLSDRNVRLAFAYGEDDMYRFQFEKEVYDPYLRDTALGASSEVTFLPGCNHAFTLRAWQTRALDIALASMQRPTWGRTRTT